MTCLGRTVGKREGVACPSPEVPGISGSLPPSQSSQLLFSYVQLDVFLASTVGTATEGM